MRDAAALSRRLIGTGLASVARRSPSRPPISRLARLSVCSVARVPTAEDVRAYSPSELEAARLQLVAALDGAEHSLASDFSVEAAQQRTHLARVLAMTLLRLGSPLDAEQTIVDALGVPRGVTGGEAARWCRARGGDAGCSSEEKSCEPAPLEMAFLLGVCYQKSGRTREALAAFEEVLRESEGHWRARYHTALLAIGGGRRAGAEGRRATAPHDEGEAALRRVLACQPEHAGSLSLLARLEERQRALRNELQVPACR
ncbi:hypothetical protein EMIHUDRAFT_457641 [Emiliania huxleyi CCMP1516]|uniref:Uncharacterized protein n=2 Tax=Emiliania huxleyi TaxID=2903 RepID=A0A0D3JN97_EMIH1|nr:hypothetical protein EMIHUDRAFT_457641 [Emiliania huxleyi CCMP1516]EOD24982.1 hypothetical protein EMIHUDRAFT_457641 [Emiliania huxleyi CCMP1516]|eukprot:XP_005777411.1 hypothetical protein EMIHUDRAFT_457641 [Emiliania huxleyi CCMP1516]